MSYRIDKSTILVRPIWEPLPEGYDGVVCTTCQNALYFPSPKKVGVYKVTCLVCGFNINFHRLKEKI